MTYGVMGLGLDAASIGRAVANAYATQKAPPSASAGSAGPSSRASTIGRAVANAYATQKAPPSATPGSSFTRSQPARVGHAAAQDPILGSASLMAASLLRQVSGLPESKRIDAARRKLNAIHPGLGNTAVSKAKELRRKGRPFNQALFDGMRLAIANRVAEYTAARMGVSGLGAVKTENLQAGFCAMIGAGTAGAGMAAAFKNPTATEGILSSGQAGGQIAGCGAGTLSQQAAATQAQLDAAAAVAAASSSSGGGTSLWLWAGLGLVAIAGIGLVVVKAKS